MIKMIFVTRYLKTNKKIQPNNISSLTKWSINKKTWINAIYQQILQNNIRQK
jgi:hypothetical protein